MSNCAIESPGSPRFPEVTRDELVTDVGRAMVMARMYKGRAYCRPNVKGWMVWNPQNGRWLDCCHPQHQGLWDWLCQEFLEQWAEHAGQLGVGGRQREKMRSQRAWAAQRRLTRHQPPF